MNKTSIEWVVNPDGSQGYTWNPVTGCLHGCDYCYARKIAMRFQGNFEPEFHPERLNDPLKIKKPSTIFVCSMADMFGEWVKLEWIEQVLEVVRKCPQHKFLFLTKNPIRYNLITFPANCFIGYTHTAGNGYYTLKDAYYISAEPLMGEIHLPPEGNLGWIIIGALNSNGKPCVTKKEWVISLIEQADRFRVPVFVKNSLYEMYPDLPQRRELPYLKHENTI